MLMLRSAFPGTDLHHLASVCISHHNENAGNFLQLVPRSLFVWDLPVDEKLVSALVAPQS